MVMTSFKLNHFFVLIVALFVISACDSPKNEEEKQPEQKEKSIPAELEELCAKVMEVHDVSMPYYTDLDLHRQFVDSVAAIIDDEDEVAHLKHQSEQLAEAKKGMHEWMVGYKASYYEDHNLEESKAYYQAELKKIEEVTKLTEEAIKAFKGNAAELRC